MFIPVNVLVAQSSPPPAPPVVMTKPIAANTAPNDIRTRIRSYIKPVKDRNMQGSGTFSLIICTLLFSTVRNSETAMYEAGFKLPIREDLVEDYVDEVLERANLHFHQHFAITIPEAEPEAFFP